MEVGLGGYKNSLPVSGVCGIHFHICEILGRSLNLSMPVSSSVKWEEIIANT